MPYNTQTNFLILQWKLLLIFPCFALQSNYYIFCKYIILINKITVNNLKLFSL